MNCRDAIDQLDRIIFEDAPIDAALRQHIDTCSSCSKAYKDALKAREVMNFVRRSEPVLRNPDELTDNIMSSIRQWPNSEKRKAKSEQRIANSERRITITLQRLLAAASIALFLLFGYEQYGVVTKVTALEKKFSEIKLDSPYSDPQRLASVIDINRAGISFSEIRKLLSTMNGTTPRSLSSFTKQMNQKNIK